MAEADLPTPELLRKLLRYDPETGELFWRKRSHEFFTPTPNRSVAVQVSMWNGKYAGRQALIQKDKDGYNYGEVLGQTLRAHRVIWAIAHGKWPSEVIDHMNGVRDDNRLTNLRLATYSENSRNRRSARTSRCPYLGVTYHKSNKRWRALIRIDRKQVTIGYFKTAEAAARAYDAAAREHFGDFANPNFPE